MTDETDTTSEVARVAEVLTDHPDWYIKGESTHDDMVFGCQGCTVEVWRDESGSDAGDLTQPREAFAKHQAAMLAEAGLLREEPFSVEGMEIMSGWLVESAGEHTCGMGGYGEPHEPGCGYVPVQRLDDLPGWPGAELARLTEERDRLKRGGAELGRQIDHYLTWVLDATGMHHLIDEDGDGDWGLVWERLAEMGQAQKAAEGPEADPECPCAACDPGLILDGKPTGLPSRMSVCPDCGNKRCPKAANHARWQCSGSNAVGQVGVPVEHEHRWVEQTTYADSARGVTVSACTVPGCRAELEERA